MAREAIRTTWKEERQMPFQKGQSGNLLGRPLGARSKATIIAEMLLQGEAEELTRLVIERAKAGDMAALRMCLDRAAPPCKHRTIAFELPPLESPADAASALAAIMAAVGAGELTPSEAGELSKLVDGFKRMFEATILEQRVAKLEREVISAASSGQDNQASQSDRSDRSDQNNSPDPYNFGDAP
jgi:Family of unknown function (DUF5681)